MEPVPAISLKLDDSGSMNVLKNCKYTPAIWQWDRFPVFNLDYVTQERNKHLTVSIGGVFIYMVGIWMNSFVPNVYTLLSNLPPPLPQY